MTTDYDIPLALFGAIFDGDPIDLTGKATNAVKETQYPSLEGLAYFFKLRPKFLYDKLLKDGRLVFVLQNDQMLVATHAYYHDNNTTARLQ